MLNDINVQYKISNNKKIKMYCISQEDDYIQLAAKHYYIQFGSAYNKDNIQKVVEECIATTLIENKSMTKWIQLISEAHLQVKCMQSNKRTKEDSVVEPETNLCMPCAVF